MDRFTEAGWTLAVCTNKRIDLTRLLLDALGLTPRFGAILGAVSVGGGLGGASGSLISGALYDWTGDYNAVLLFAIFAVALGSTPFWLVRALAQR